MIRLSQPLFLCLFVFAFSVPVPAQTTPKIPIAINVSDHNYYHEPVFTNMVYSMEDWHLKNADGSGGYSSGCPLDSLQADSNGYPLFIPQTITGYAPQMVEAPLGWMYPTGNYVVLWDGAGTLHFNGATVVSTAANRMVISRTRGQQTFLQITQSTTGNYLRNLRIVPAALESADIVTHPFLPAHMNVVNKFHCLRFMGWQGTNCSTQKFWSKRRLPTAFNQSTSADKGPAIEYCITMCNEANADLWFCVPHQADDDYLDKCAALIKSKLNPNHKLYLEYSNECWNWGAGFCQFGWINATNGVGGCAGAADSIKNAILQIWQNGGSHFETYGWLADRTFKHFRAVWTGADQQRLVRVCATQFGDQRSLTKVLSMGGCDALAYAPYFNFGSADVAFCGMGAGNVTTAQVIDSLSTHVDMDLSSLRSAGTFAKSRGVKLVYYECGPDYGYNSCIFASNALGDSIHKSAYVQGMYDVYVKDIRYSADTSVNCQLFTPLILYGAGEHYGHLDSAAQAALPTAQQPPKWRALMDCMATKPTVGVIEGLTPRAASQTGVTRTFTRTAVGSRAALAMREHGAVIYNLCGRRLRGAAPACLDRPVDGVYVVKQKVMAKNQAQ
jgi:hypothetical protein